VCRKAPAGLQDCLGLSIDWPFKSCHHAFAGSRHLVTISATKARMTKELAAKIVVPMTTGKSPSSAELIASRPTPSSPKIVSVTIARPHDLGEFHGLWSSIIKAGSRGGFS
jgi:hypothetical protein